LCKKKENVLAFESHDGGARLYMPSLWFIDILILSPFFFQHRKELIVPLAWGFTGLPVRYSRPGLF
jgi:hypothetical protein